MHNTFRINSLERVAIVGVGLLGGSIGLALRAAGFTGRLVGIGRRMSSLKKALAVDAVDEVTRDVGAVAGAQLVILCTPISQFGPLLERMAPALKPGTYVTDVASAKVEVVRLAGRMLPRDVHFIGSHPMAGSEKAGVEFARADLFQRALCLVTPTARTSAGTVRWVRSFWEVLGGRTVVLSPQRHDELLARVSHLPHAVAAALVALAERKSAIDLAGPGFADTTRIASGEPGMWVDIFGANRKAMLRATDELIDELKRFRGYLNRKDMHALLKWLNARKRTRDRWVAQRYRKQVLPP